LVAAALQQRHYIEGPAEVTVAGALNGVKDSQRLIEKVI
jgi:hypothetical protein